MANLPPTARAGVGASGAGAGGGGDHHRRISSSAHTIGSLDLSASSATGRPGQAGGVDVAGDTATGNVAAAAAATGGGAEEGGGGESSSSEGDMTWEDFLASTDDLGEPARTAAMASASSMTAAAPNGVVGDTAVPRRPQQQQQQLLQQQQQQQQQRPAPTRRSSSGGTTPVARGGTAAAAPPPPPATEAPSQPSHANSLTAARGQEAGTSFGSGFTSWGTSRADENESDQGSAESGAGSDGDGDGAALKQVCFDLLHLYHLVFLSSVMDSGACLLGSREPLRMPLFSACTWGVRAAGGFVPRSASDCLSEG